MWHQKNYFPQESPLPHQSVALFFSLSFPSCIECLGNGFLHPMPQRIIWSNPIFMYLFPGAAVNKLPQPDGVKQQVLLLYYSSRGSRWESVPCSCQLPMAVSSPWLITPIFQASLLKSLLHLHITFSSLYQICLCIPLIRMHLFGDPWVARDRIPHQAPCMEPASLSGSLSASLSLCVSLMNK